MSGRTFSLVEDLVQAGLLDVEDLAPQRQDRLEAPVAALLGRAAGRVALDDVELAAGRVALLAVGELAGQRQPVERALADDEVAGLAGRLAGAGGGQALLDDPAAVAGFSSRYWARPSATAVSTWPLTSGLPSLAFVWPSNWGSVELDADDGVRPSRTSSPERLSSLSLRTPALRAQSFSELVERGAEAGHVAAAVDRVDVVGEGEDVLGVRVVVLEGDLDGGLPFLALDVDRAWVEDVLVPVQVADEGLDAALEVERALPIRCARRAG